MSIEVLLPFSIDNFLPFGVKFCSQFAGRAVAESFIQMIKHIELIFWRVCLFVGPITILSHEII